MEDSTLKFILDTLNLYRSILDGWLTICNWVVVVGVLLEVVSVTMSHGDEKKEWHVARTSGIIPLPSRPRRILLVADLLSVFLVVFGIAGELTLESTRGKLETSVEHFNELRVLRLQQEAGDAELSAVGAAKAARKASDDSDKATDKAANASRVANDAEDNANSATASAKKLEAKIAAATNQLAAISTQVQVVEEKRSRLEKSIVNMAVCNTPRVIENWYVTGAGGSSYVDSLRGFKTKNAALVFNDADPESKRAATNIGSALVEAGWNVTHSQPPIQNIQDGVRVQSRNSYNPNVPSDLLSGDDSIDAARAIVKFLHSYLWQAKWEPGYAGDRSFPPHSIRILIGLYPPTQFVTPPALEAIQTKRQEIDQLFDSEIRAMQAKDGDLQPCQPVHLVVATP